MPGRTSNRSHKSRELRRRILLAARARTSKGWSDVCILNISTRGLLIHGQSAAIRGSIIEVRHGEHVIVARVAWRSGSRLGLRAEERVPVEQILLLGKTSSLKPAASNVPGVDRRRHSRAHEHSRQRSRMIEFASIVAIAASLGIAASSLVAEAIATPMAKVGNALGNPPAAAKAP